MLNTTLLMVCALLLDRLLGEPRRFHPLVGFGRYASWLEQHLNPDNSSVRSPLVGAQLAARFSKASRSKLRSYSAILRWMSIASKRARGVLAWLLAIAPFLALCIYLWQQPLLRPWISILVLYFALGLHSLNEHASRIQTALQADDLSAARLRVGEIVSRDTTAMQAEDVARASVESVLENGNDAVFGALFWFALLGAPGALLYRLANTLDAMWGYRTPRYAQFGWAAARLDDALNFVPARLTALSYAVLGHVRTALHCWRQQAPAWESPNAGPVMASGAGSLNILLGGAANYHGVQEQRPTLGAGNAPQAADIGRALQLVRRGVWLWLAVLFALGAGFA